MIWIAEVDEAGPVNVAPKPVPLIDTLEMSLVVSNRLPTSNTAPGPTTMPPGLKNQILPLPPGTVVPCKVEITCH